MGSRHGSSGFVGSVGAGGLLVALLVMVTSAGSVLAEEGQGIREGEPTSYMSEHPLATVLANDVARTSRRFAASPYADLASTPWGALVVARLEHALDPRGNGGITLPALAASVTRAVVAVEAIPGGQRPDIRLAVATGEDSAPMLALCRSLAVADGEDAGALDDPWFSGGGSMTHIGRVFAFRNGGAFGPTAPVRAPRFPDACFEVSLDRERIGAALGSPAGFQRDDPPAAISVALRLDDIGMREHWEIPVPVARLDTWRGLKLEPAHREVLDRLPPTTLCACTFHGEGGAAVSALMASGLLDDPMALAALDLAMARAGVPPLLQVLASLHGDAVVYVEDGAPFPWLTIATGMDEDVAREILPILAIGVGMAPEGDDGVLGGFLGVSAFQAGYRDGQLILTTNPAGVDGYLKRQGGFTADAQAKAALAEIPPEAAFIGISRSGPATAAMARLALQPAAHLGVPQLATLPNDLGTRGRHGFFSARGTADGVTVDAGGIIGGPLCSYALISGTVYATYIAGARRMQRQLQDLHRRHEAAQGRSEKSM